MKRKHITAAVLSALLMASSAVTAFADPYDFFQISLNKKHSILDVATKTQVLLDVATKESDFTIELKDGKKYPLADYIKVMKDNPTFTEDQVIEELNKMGLKVVSVSAISPKEIKIDFSKVVNDADKAQLDVQVSGSPALVKAWTDGDKSLELKRAVDFPEGKYTVIVKLAGQELAKQELEFKKSAPSKIVINGDVIAKDLAAPLDVEILNQYGQKVTPVPLAQGFAVNKTEPGRKVSVVAYNRYNTDKCEMGDQIEITVVLNSDPTIKATKTLKVGYPAEKAIEVVFGEVKMPTDKTEINPGATFRIPMTVKKNGVELKPAADINLTNAVSFNFDGVTLTPFFDATVATTAKYVKADKEVEIALHADTKAKTHHFRIMDSNGTETAVSYVVVAPEKPATIVPVVEPIHVDKTKDFDLEFKLIGDRGNEIKWTDAAAAGYTVDQKGNQVPEDGTAPGAAVVATKGAFVDGKLSYTVAAKSGTITLVLKKGVEEVAKSEVPVSVVVGETLSNIGVKLESAAVTKKVGDTFKVMLEAQDAGNAFIPTYNTAWENVKFVYGAGNVTVHRNVEFKNGKATIELPAKKTNAGFVTVTFPGGAPTKASTDTITVEVGDPANLVVKKKDGTNLTLEMTDIDGNLTAYAEKGYAKFEVPAGVTVTGADAENNLEITFAAGKVDIPVSAVAVGTYKVTFKTFVGTLEQK